ncbi:hypothetical protein DYB26_004767 [Aphanomyces astaci]|uniref:DDE-1 domain-containing protein n=1 Tax=Aphanomyces astaci TaxID=112090 RepID=A0A397FFZ7_APHAT|nr:hypothetical protein DYB36_011782 [Aphanomyces astaci]RHY92779.1 hypothetical protein DYB26_004767 [Aphanomyces astaci]RHZ30175.1 hypothetical protein DYB31_013397 [Aphanomyces astaci]
MPPRYIWSQRGGSPKLSKGENHSYRMTAVLTYRMTAVLTIRRDGLKLPILSVIKGQHGGRIDTNEFPSYPPGHYSAVQNKAWMDSGVWKQYLWFVLVERVTGKSVLVLDNFESHVSAEGKETASLLCVRCLQTQRPMTTTDESIDTVDAPAVTASARQMLL